MCIDWYVCTFRVVQISPHPLDGAKTGVNTDTPLGMFVVAGLESAGIVFMISAFWIPENKIYAAFYLRF